MFDDSHDLIEHYRAVKARLASGRAKPVDNVEPVQELPPQISSAPSSQNLKVDPITYQEIEKASLSRRVAAAKAAREAVLAREANAPPRKRKRGPRASRAKPKIQIPRVVLTHPNPAKPPPPPPPKQVIHPNLRVRHIVEPILRAHKIPWADVIGPSRARTLIPVRLTIYVALHNAGYSLVMIGRFCKRDHTTILHYLTKWAGYQKAPRPNPYRVTFK